MYPNGGFQNSSNKRINLKNEHILVQKNESQKSLTSTN